MALIICFEDKQTIDLDSFILFFCNLTFINYIILLTIYNNIYIYISPYFDMSINFCRFLLFIDNHLANSMKYQNRWTHNSCRILKTAEKKRNALRLAAFLKCPANVVTLNRVHARERWRLARESLSGKIPEKNSSEVGQRAQFPGRRGATDGTDLADAALERFVFLCTGHVPRFLAATDPRPMFRKPY